MVIGAIPKVLEHMVALGERRLPDPVRTLTAHMGKPGGVAIHPLHHIVTADPGISPAALGQFGRAVVRATRTEIRDTRRDFLGIVGPFRLGDLRHPGLDRLGAAPLLNEDIAKPLCNHDRVKRRLGLEQFRPMHRPRTAALVPAIDPAAPAVVKDRFLDLHLDELALFLDHDNQVEPLGPVMEPPHIKREGLPDLIGRDAKTLRLGLINPQERQRMHQIEPVFARRDKADLRPRLAPHALVHLVGMTKGFGSKAFIVDHPRFLRVRRVC